MNKGIISGLMLLFMCQGSGAQTFPVQNLVVNGTFTATGKVGLSNLAPQSANTIVGNGTSSSASPTALNIPSCSASGHALQWVSNSGFSCASTVGTGQLSQTSSGQFFSDNGAQVNQINDRLFIGALTPFSGAITNAIPDWTGSSFVVGGVPAFSYLEENGTVNVSSVLGEGGIVSALRTSDGGGGGGQVSLGISSVVVNDNGTGGGAASANFYGTSVRTATATGPSMGNMELDNTNMGATVPIWPFQPFAVGETNVLNLAAGGELPNQAGSSYTINNTTSALTISSNANLTAYPNAVFDKGIVFASNAFNSNNVAIAFAPGHRMDWFNSSNQLVGVITSTATTPATGQELALTPTGTIVSDLSGNTQFQVGNSVVGAVNYVQVIPAATGGAPEISAVGSNTNINLFLQGKGTGGVFINGPMLLSSYTVSTLPACNSSSKGGMVYVTDASSPTYNSTISGGGPTAIPAFCNGSNWTAH